MHESLREPLLRTANKQTPYWVAKPVRTRFFCTHIQAGASAHGDGCDTVNMRGEVISINWDSLWVG